MLQVKEALAERAGRIAEQQELPVFKAAALQGAPADYQSRARSPPPAPRSKPPAPTPSSANTAQRPPRPSFGPPSVTPPTSAPPSAGAAALPPRPSFGPPTVTPASERKTPVWRYETSQANAEADSLAMLGNDHHPQSFTSCKIRCMT